MLGAFSNCREGTTTNHYGRNPGRENLNSVTAMPRTEGFTFQFQAGIPKNTDWWLKQARDPVKGYFTTTRPLLRRVA
jgi:hypothetical protein